MPLSGPRRHTILFSIPSFDTVLVEISQSMVLARSRRGDVVIVCFNNNNNSPLARPPLGRILVEQWSLLSGRSLFVVSLLSVDEESTNNIHPGETNYHDNNNNNDYDYASHIPQPFTNP